MKTEVVFGLNRVIITLGIGNLRKHRNKKVGYVQMSVLNRKVDVEKDMNEEGFPYNDTIGMTNMVFPNIDTVDSMISTLNELRSRMVKEKVDCMKLYQEKEELFLPNYKHYSQVMLMGNTEKVIIAHFLTRDMDEIRSTKDLMVIIACLKGLDLIDSNEFTAMVMLPDNNKNIKATIKRLCEVIYDNFNHFHRELICAEYQEGFLGDKIETNE